MSNAKYPKPDAWITIASGWSNNDESGNFTSIRCTVNPEKNAKSNKGQAYKLFAVPVDNSGEPSGEALEVNSFAVGPSNADKQKYENAPDWRVFFGIFNK